MWTMYLVSLYEKESIVEASLGGRVTADEIAVFGEELLDLVLTFENKPFTLLLDHSKTKRFDGNAVQALCDVKDQCHAAGAALIVCAPIDEQDQVIHETARIQQVLEGSEQFMATVSQLRYARSIDQAERKAA
jgi:anti-anti-sigma regulatory factor